MSSSSHIELINRALQLAHLRQCTVWVSVSEVVENSNDPMPLWNRYEHHQRQLLWTGDSWMLGVESSHCVNANGPSRFSHLSHERTLLYERLLSEGTLPRCMVSCAYEDNPFPHSQWGKQLQGARLTLPRRQWIYSAETDCCVCIHSLAVHDGDNPVEKVTQLFAELPTPPPSTYQPPAATPHIDYQNQVADVLPLLQTSALRKVVLARSAHMPLPTAFERSDLIRTLHEQGDQDTTVYAWDLSGDRCFIGATPELLLHLDGTTCTSMALAGSRPRGNTESDDAALAHDLFQCTKERKEHQLVVEHISKVLSARCVSVDDYHAPDHPSLRKLAALQHLQTDITATLRTHDLFEMLAHLHPTPAVCGLPLETAQQYIRRHEGLARGLYTGILGYCTPNLAHCVVPLRGGIFTATNACLFAGAGLVETSQPEKEYTETVLKMKQLTEAVRLKK